MNNLYLVPKQFFMAASTHFSSWNSKEEQVEADS